jgi:serine/threonine-protein kinase
MGVVYGARHVRLDRPVAIKLMHAAFAASEAAVRRFFDEARAAGGLRHPNVIDVLDVDTDDAPGAAPFMVMEMLEGEPLSALLARRGPLPVEEALAIVDPVLAALEAAHANGIVHRDLKPDNVFLAREHDAVVPKLLDFGIAKLRDAEGPGTATGSIVGTPMYMSPEQAAGARAVGPSIDVWAMGAVLFEMLSGRSHLALSEEPNVMEILAALATQTPPRLREVAPHVPEVVARAVDEALVRDPSARTPSITAFRARLRGGALPPTVAASPAPLPPTRQLAPPRIMSSPPKAPSAGGPRLAAVMLLLLAGLGTLAAGALAWRARLAASSSVAVDAAGRDPVDVTDTVTASDTGTVTDTVTASDTDTVTASDTDTAGAPDTMTTSDTDTAGAPDTDTVTAVRERGSPRRPRTPAPRGSAATRTGTWNPDDL